MAWDDNRRCSERHWPLIAECKQGLPYKTQLNDDGFDWLVIDAASNIVRWLTDITLNQEQMQICVNCIIWELPLLFMLNNYDMNYSIHPVTVLCVQWTRQMNRTKHMKLKFERT